jgi:hypothetical protein
LCLRAETAREDFVSLDDSLHTRTMKLLAVFAVLVVATANVVKQKDDDRTITKVVKLLQGMLEKSKVQGEEEAEIYDKFRCFCLDS